MAISKDVSVEYNLEYRSTKDDAWYTSGVVLEGGKKLRVKFMEFVQRYYDEVFSIDDFSDNNEIEELLRRFRLGSEPIEENECSRVKKDMVVCATYTGDGLVRYFNAKIVDEQRKEHTPEKCLCTYLLIWKHGPDEGNMTATSLADIWLITGGAVDSRVADFAKLAREKLGRASSQSTLISNRPFLSRKTRSNKTPDKLQELGSSGHSSHVGFSEGRGRFNPQLSDQDSGMGGFKKTCCHHYILLENLEKDLSPILMMEFIREQTSITAQAYVFPSLPFETYARGAIVLDSKTKLKRIYDFISDPNHLIISFSGRPWVIADDPLRTGTFNSHMQRLEAKSEIKNPGSVLMAVELGTEEYARAKLLKDLYMDFSYHRDGLLRTLDSAEKESLHPASAT